MASLRATLLGVRPRFYSPGATGSGIAPLPEDESHHLRHVLRLGSGADLSVFDGQGHEWSARVASVPRRGPVLVEIGQPMQPVAEPPVSVALGMGLLRGDQMDAAVRDATMLGVAEIAPFISDHVVVPARAWKGGAAVGRWQRIAVSSAKQCGRAVVPVVKAPAPLSDLIVGDEAAVRLICVEPRLAGAEAVGGAHLPRRSRAIVLVGPEGGWSDEELAIADRHGVRRVHLGPRTLRAETAPTVLLSALWTIWGWT
jgi:16S rRNA (uracil1498-N3)-methyltransferase